MTGEIVAIIVLVVVNGGLLWLILSMQKHFKEMSKDLLNRVMARNYETFVQGDVVRAQAEKPLTPEEIYEKQYERGIPV